MPKTTTQPNPTTPTKDNQPKSTSLPPHPQTTEEHPQNNKEKSPPRKRAQIEEPSDSNEAEILEELQKLQRPSGVAGTSGVPTKKKFFKPDVTIQTGIPENPSQVAKIVRGTLKQNAESLKQDFIIIGGNTKLHFPDVKISGSSEDEKLKDIAKYFSMIIPTQMTANSQNVRYFIRKGAERVENETMIEFSEHSFQTIVNTATKVFFPYLKTVNGKKVQEPHELPEKPESVILEENHEKKEKLVLRIDDFDFDFGGRRTRYMPNISIRIWKQGRNGWYRTQQGVTMSCYNFYFFVMATMKFFVTDVKTIFESVQEGLNQYSASYDDSEDEIEHDPEIAEMPFLN